MKKLDTDFLYDFHAFLDKWFPESEFEFDHNSIPNTIAKCTLDILASHNLLSTRPEVKLPKIEE